MNAHDRGAEPAYPWGEHGTVLGGLTVREAFAMAAMQGILANGTILERHGLAPDGVGKEAVEFADALIHHLSLNQEPRT